MSEQAAFIVNIATHVREKIKKDVCYTIGARSFLADHFQSCSFVSGKHVEVTWDGVQFSVKDVSRNGTYISGQRIEKGKIITVPSGTVIGLGDVSPSQPLAAHFRLDSNVD